MGPVCRKERNCFWSAVLTAISHLNHDTTNYHVNALRCERSVLGRLEKKINEESMFSSRLSAITLVMIDQIMSLTMDRSSQQAAHVQDAACGFRMRSCNTHTLLKYCSCGSFRMRLWGICGRGVTLCAFWPEWDIAEVVLRSGCSSSSLCCLLYPTCPQTLSEWTNCCCVWCSALCHLNSTVHMHS